MRRERITVRGLVKRLSASANAAEAENHHESAAHLRALAAVVAEAPPSVNWFAYVDSFGETHEFDVGQVNK